MELFGQLATVVGLSSLISAVVSGFITNYLHKKERNYSFNKEEYGQLQKKAEIVFGNLYHYEVLLSTMYGQLSSHMISLEIFNKNSEEFDRFKLQIFQVMHVYFWDKSTIYNQYNKAVNDVISIYFKIAKARVASEEDISEIKLLDKELDKWRLNFTEEILAFLEEKRRKLI